MPFDKDFERKSMEFMTRYGISQCWLAQDSSGSVWVHSTPPESNWIWWRQRQPAEFVGTSGILMSPTVIHIIDASAAEREVTLIPTDLINAMNLRVALFRDGVHPFVMESLIDELMMTDAASNGRALVDASGLIIGLSTQNSCPYVMSGSRNKGHGRDLVASQIAFHLAGENPGTPLQFETEIKNIPFFMNMGFEIKFPTGANHYATATLDCEAISEFINQSTVHFDSYNGTTQEIQSLSSVGYWIGFGKLYLGKPILANWNNADTDTSITITIDGEKLFTGNAANPSLRKLGVYHSTQTRQLAVTRIVIPPKS